MGGPLPHPCGVDEVIRMPVVRGLPCGNKAMSPTSLNTVEGRRGRSCKLNEKPCSRQNSVDFGSADKGLRSCIMAKP